MSRKIIYLDDAIDALSHMCSEDENGITVSRANVNSMLSVLPSAQQEEPSYEAVKEYCRKRCLSIVDSALLKKYASAHPEIIRCNVCRHWHQTTGKMKGFGLGDCDYLEKKLVTCSGYCYWAERG